MKSFTRNCLMTLLSVTAGALLLASPGYAQEEYFDAEFMEGGAFQPDFITPEEVKQLMDDGDESFLLVDNAPAMAYEEEHIPGAISYPWTRDIALPVTLPRNKTLIMYCPCGPDDADSIDMAKKLRMFGYFRVKVLHGGWFAWLDKGYPIYESESEDEDA